MTILKGIILLLSLFGGGLLKGLFKITLFAMAVMVGGAIFIRLILEIIFGGLF